MMAPPPPVWLRGVVPDVPQELQGVAHGLIEALEEVKHAILGLSPAVLWVKPSGAASLGFHLRHIAGATDRLFTYARGDELSENQRRALVTEQSEPLNDLSSDTLLGELERTIDRALGQLRSTPVTTLDDERRVGRKELPSSVRGLLEHAAQHACRHAGQIVTTAKIVQTQEPNVR